MSSSSSSWFADVVKVLYYWKSKSLVDFVSLLFLSSLLHLRELYYNLQLMSTTQKYFHNSNCRPNCRDVYRLKYLFSALTIALNIWSSCQKISFFQYFLVCFQTFFCSVLVIIFRRLYFIENVWRGYVWSFKS